MKPTEETEMVSRTGSDKKTSNAGDKKISLEMVSHYFAEETVIDTQSNELRFTLRVYKEHKLRIYKPLVFVKLALFFWFAGGHGVHAFFFVFLKQRGLSVAHVSLIMAASVVFQFLLSSLSGVIADKIGSAKPVLFAHMTISVIVSIAFLLMPPLTPDSTTAQFQLRSRKYDNISRMRAEAWCNSSKHFNEHKTCEVYYSTNKSNYPNDSNEEHCFLTTSVENNISQITFVANGTNILENIKNCHDESEAALPSGTSYTFCNFSNCKLLKIECISETEKCSHREINRIILLSVYSLLIALHYTAVSCIFRFYDIAVISLTSEHNADFGNQRMFSILGNLIGPSLIGNALQAISGSDKNYSLTFVFYISFIAMSALAFCNVNIRVKEPGQRMWRKVLALVKNPDILEFILILLVLGTSFNFMLIYSNWYLEGLGASKVLLGMFVPISNVFALLAMPISKWFVLKFGTQNIFIVALVGYAFFGISFSFLIEPWFSVFIGAVAYTICYHLLWVAVVEYAHRIAPEGLHASVNAMAGALHFTVAKVSAGLIGGTIMNAYGGRIAFRVIGCTNLVTAVLYGTFRYFRGSYSKQL